MTRTRSRFGSVVGLVLLLGLFAGAAEAMQIFVQLPAGNAITLEVQGSDSIQNVKQQVEAATGIPVDRQRLYFSGVLLLDNRTLADYNIQTQSTLLLVVAGFVVEVPTLSLPAMLLLALGLLAAGFRVLRRPVLRA